VAMTQQEGIQHANSGEPNSMAQQRFGCSVCALTKPTANFSPSVVANKQHICRDCSKVRSRHAASLRRGCPIRMLMRKLRKLMHKTGSTRCETKRLKLSCMDRVARRFGLRSVFSGVHDISRLTVARWDSSLPVTFENIVVCTHAEASQHNKHTLATYNQRFVAHVESNLLPCGATTSAVVPPRSRFKSGLDARVVIWFMQMFGGVHRTPARHSCQGYRMKSY
jgi:hypothetical protein